MGAATTTLKKVVLAGGVKVPSLYQQRLDTYLQSTQGAVTRPKLY